MERCSQNDIDEKDRRALEQELATEVAALSTDSLWLDNDQHDASVDPSADYVRLDLDAVIKQVTEDGRHMFDQIVAPSWTLWLQSLERSDCECFQPWLENLHHLRTSLLNATTVPTPRTEPQQKQHHDQKTIAPLLDSKGDPLGRKASMAFLEMIEEDANPESFRSDMNRILDDCHHVPTKSIANNLKVPSGRHSVLDPTLSPELSNEGHREPLVLSPVSPRTRLKTDQVAQEQVKQEQLQAIGAQHKARETQRLKTRTRYEKRRLEVAKLLRQLEDEGKLQEREVATLRQEGHERSSLALEEKRGRLVAVSERERQECAMMTRTDIESQRVGQEFDRVQRNWCIMEAEDQAETYRIRTLHHTQQEIVARSCMGIVLIALTTCFQSRQQLLAQEIDRERYECVQLQAQEVSTRQVMAEKSRQDAQQERGRNQRRMMENERLARSIETRKRHQVEERIRESNSRKTMQMKESESRAAAAFVVYERHVVRQIECHACCAMEREEMRTRSAWMHKMIAETKECERQCEVQRLAMSSQVLFHFQRLRDVVERHQVIECLATWKRWRVLESSISRLHIEKAARRIQRWHRSCRQDVQALKLLKLRDDEAQWHQRREDEERKNVEPNTVKGQEAVLCLQTRFRGFHVRRRFAKALVLAQEVYGNEEDLKIKSIDIDDFIERPPELSVGWGIPVLPRAVGPDLRDAALEQHSSDVTFRRDNTTTQGMAKGSSQLQRDAPGKEFTLAAMLWNKMKRGKQRQRDPVSRVHDGQKRKTSTACSGQRGNLPGRHSVQEGPKTTRFLSWAITTTTAKQKVKITLPSVVERLRRQILAERQ